MNNAALLAELEQAKEGSRALSDKVLTALGWKTGIGTHADFTKFHAPDGSPPSRDRPDPSRNLQDIVDLVPEGLGWSLGPGLTKRHLAIVAKPEWFFDSSKGMSMDPCEADSPALSLCIAILRAMESAGDDTGENHE